VETLSAAFKKAIDTNDFAAFMKDVGGSPGYVGFKELPTFIESVVKETSQLLGGIGVKVKQTQ
jgi:tripartite-type tricarboxylate transporter receptor subunit TctC